ncbi:helix-turn-helix domain-containing protein [Myxococcota bacterium]|nr:helix-turn-helix domain-containing protein [Myxococcota bacterium]
MLGERIRALRKQKGWTLKDLAERADVSWSMISHIERGERTGTMQILAKIAEALDVSPSLLQEDVEPEQLEDISRALEGMATLSREQMKIVLSVIEGLRSTSKQP